MIYSHLRKKEEKTNATDEVVWILVVLVLVFVHVVFVLCIVFFSICICHCVEMVRLCCLNLIGWSEIVAPSTPSDKRYFLFAKILFVNFYVFASLSILCFVLFDHVSYFEIIKYSVYFHHWVHSLSLCTKFVWIRLEYV